MECHKTGMNIVESILITMGKCAIKENSFQRGNKTNKYIDLTTTSRRIYIIQIFVFICEVELYNLIINFYPALYSEIYFS